MTNSPLAGGDAPAKPAQQNPESPTDLENLWRWISVPLFIYCVAMWIRTQSNNYELVKFIANDANVARITGLFATPVAFVSLFLASRYATSSGGTQAAERVPRVTEKGLDGRTGKVFRLWLFAAFWMATLGSQIHFLDGVLHGSIVETNSCSKVTGWAAMLTETPSAAHGERLPPSECTPSKESKERDHRFANVNGTTYFPIVETWFWLIAVASLTMNFAWYVVRRLRPPTARGTPQTGHLRGLDSRDH
jgi:hypothetical protein